MKKKIKKLHLQEKKRYLKKIFGTEFRPRLSVFRSNQHIYAQLIDDTYAKTLAFASTLEKTLFSEEASIVPTKTMEAAFLVGKLVAKKGQEKGCSTVVFDRGTRRYHGRIKRLAEGAREGGLIF